MTCATPRRSSEPWLCRCSSLLRWFQAGASSLSGTGVRGTVVATHGGVVTARGDTSVEAAEVAGSCASLERVCVRPGDPARPLGRRRCPVSWGVGGQGRAVPDESAPCRAARQAHPGRVSWCWGQGRRREAVGHVAVVPERGRPSVGAQRRGRSTGSRRCSRDVGSGVRPARRGWHRDQNLRRKRKWQVRSGGVSSCLWVALNWRCLSISR